jgi:hypothetical protein
MLRENFDPAASVVGMDVKVIVGAVFAEIVSDAQLADDLRALARHAGVDANRLAAARAFARGDDAQPLADDGAASGALTLARAASHSPSRIDASTVLTCQDSGLSAAAIVEVITWLSVLQMLHRLSCYAMPID